MMGAGSQPAGVSPGGISPQPAPSPPAAMSSPLSPILGPRAEQFNPTTKRFVMNANGSVADTHPVDQAVVLEWTTAANAIPSAPDVGTDLSDVRSSADPNLAAKVDTALRLAVKTFTDAGDIVVTGTAADSPAGSKGRIEDQGTYQNLRIAPVQNS